MVDAQPFLPDSDSCSTSKIIHLYKCVEKPKHPTSSQSYIYSLFCVIICKLEVILKCFCVDIILSDRICDEGPQTVMCHSVELHSTDKDNHEAITVRALHALLSRVTYSEQIGARCWAQGHFNRMHSSRWIHHIFSGNQTCDLYVFRAASLTTQPPSRQLFYCVILWV